MACRRVLPSGLLSLPICRSLVDMDPDTPKPNKLFTILRPTSSQNFMKLKIPPYLYPSASVGLYWSIHLFVCYKTCSHYGTWDNDMKWSTSGQGCKLDPKSGGPFLPLLPSPSSPAPSPSLPCHPFPFSSPPPMHLGVWGSAVSSPSFAAILSPENVSGGSDFCFLLWHTKCADLLKLGQS